MKGRPLLKSKKGISLESAVLFMTIIFTFCFLLSTLAIYGHYQLKVDGIRLNQFVEKEQIGQEFVAYLHTDSSADFSAYLAENSINYENYACAEVKTQDADITQYVLTVKRGGEDGSTVLYITAQKTAAGEVTVLSWLPTAPETAEE